MNESQHDPAGHGEDVEVWNTFTGAWTPGFAIAEVLDRGYRVRRLSDGSVLPVDLDDGRVRRRRSAPAPLRVPA